jgi:tRNA U34 5-methylaminomethyl-2-thiouridine-forming methyltransferase MnmC
MISRKTLVTEDGSHTIYQQDLDETYHSAHGAIRESEHVFIHAGLKHVVADGKRPIGIFEVGFGSGLNALLSWNFAEKHQISIRYHCVEPFPLEVELIEKLNYVQLLGGVQRGVDLLQLHTLPWNDSSKLSAFFEFAKFDKGIQGFECRNLFDLCYFDAFAPAKQPEMWQISVLQKIKNLLHQNGVLVTYSACGQLKRDLRALRFTVESLPGAPGKMEMVRATKS